MPYKHGKHLSTCMCSQPLSKDVVSFSLEGPPAPIVAISVLVLFHPVITGILIVADNPVTIHWTVANFYFLSCLSSLRGSRSLNTCSWGVNLRTACQRAAASNNWSSNNVFTLMEYPWGYSRCPKLSFKAVWNASWESWEWWCEPFCRQNSWTVKDAEHQGEVPAWVPGHYRSGLQWPLLSWRSCCLAGRDMWASLRPSFTATVAWGLAI